MSKYATRRVTFAAMALAGALVGAPLWAQDTAAQDTTGEDSADAATDREPEARQSSEAADATNAGATFGLKVVTGDAQTIAAHPVGAMIPEDARVCLERLQQVTVSAGGDPIEYAGPGCLEPRADLAIAAEDYGGSHVWLPLSADVRWWPRASGCEALVVAAEGPSAATWASGRRIAVDEKIVLSAADKVTLLTAQGLQTLAGPGTYAVPCAAAPRAAAAVATRGFSRARAGAVRGERAATAGNAAVRLIATHGTAGALARFPRGTLFGTAQRICLAPGERLTVAGKSGTRMTFAGPGCGVRMQGAAEDNTPAVTPG